MESSSVQAVQSTTAQDVQMLRQSLQTNLQMEKQSMDASLTTMHQHADRNQKNQMRNEIATVLSDVMTTMKKSGDEARNSGR